MLYFSFLLLIEGNSSSQIYSKYAVTIKEALDRIMTDGHMDILVVHSASTPKELVPLLISLYNICRHYVQLLGRHITYTVLPDGKELELERDQSWEVIGVGKYESSLSTVFRQLVPEHSYNIAGLPVVILKMGDLEDELTPKSSRSSTKTLPDRAGTSSSLEALANASQQIKNSLDSSFNSSPASVSSSGSATPSLENLDIASIRTVAVGGTFDHLHDGHRILLTVAGYLSQDRLIVGITGPELLKNKKYAEALQPFDVRRESVESFLKYVFPVLEVDVAMMKDIYGPTASIEDIDALVISSETRKGAKMVNDLRTEEKHWKPLQIIEINPVGGKTGSEADNWADKLSSTDLRREELERKLGAMSLKQ